MKNFLFSEAKRSLARGKIRGPGGERGHLTCRHFGSRWEGPLFGFLAHPHPLFLLRLLPFLRAVPFSRGRTLPLRASAVCRPFVAGAALCHCLAPPLWAGAFSRVRRAPLRGPPGPPLRAGPAGWGPPRGRLPRRRLASSFFRPPVPRPGPPGRPRGLLPMVASGVSTWPLPWFRVSGYARLARGPRLGPRVFRHTPSNARRGESHG